MAVPAPEKLVRRIRGEAVMFWVTACSAAMISIACWDQAGTERRRHWLARTVWALAGFAQPVIWWPIYVWSQR